ncbi:uncharacterized protein LOC134843714 isoform X4 [Symsagittifera roscoffensis]|uniref:uncharacterized protein LOC134843714 isoform X4 n=1 Tax=Symsagittifera roscoffensis TaxID=84072 RepID=UPI00307BE797
MELDSSVNIDDFKAGIIFECSREVSHAGDKTTKPDRNSVCAFSHETSWLPSIHSDCYLVELPIINGGVSSSSLDGHSRNRDGTKYSVGAYAPKAQATDQNDSRQLLSRRHRSQASSRDNILSRSGSNCRPVANYVTLTDSNNDHALLLDNTQIVRDSRSIYEGHYYPNPGFRPRSANQSYFTPSHNQNQSQQLRHREIPSRGRDSINKPGFRTASPLSRKDFHDSIISSHNQPEGFDGYYQNEAQFDSRRSLLRDSKGLRMRSQPDLSSNMVTSEFTNSNSVTLNRSSMNIHQGVLHPGDDSNNANNNSMMNNGGAGVLNNSGMGVGTNGMQVVPNNAKLGLSSKQALERLFHEVNNELQEFSRQQSLKRSFSSFWASLPFHYHHKLTTLRFHEFLLILTASVSLFVCYILEPSLGGTLIIESMGILILLFLSSLISWWDVKLYANDMYTRAQNLLDQIQETLLYMQQQSAHPSTHAAASAVQTMSSLSGVNNASNNVPAGAASFSVWPSTLYPSLHAPVSPSVSLQWTHRDHQLINLPANLLVRGDVVEIRPGQAVYARAKQLHTSKGDPLGLVLNPGETYNPLEGQGEDPCPTARLHSPMDRLACVVQETPFVTQLRKCLAHSSSRERSAWDNRRYAVVDFIEKKVIPIAVLTGLFINGVLFIAFGSDTYVGNQIEMYLLHQIYILIPLVPLLFPVLWLMWTALTTASLLASCQQQGSVVRGESVGGSCYHFKFSWKHFISIISGMSPSLSRTSNLLYGLGSTTIFSVVDKRGVLSWPNPKVERVFFIRPVEQPDDTVSPADSAGGRRNDDRNSENGSLNAVYVPEVMDLSCDQNENFFVHFDDERWQQHLPSLKPLGLNILLNTCNEYVEDSYTKFADHLLCVSSLENHSVAVVNRSWTRALQSRCACELSEAIGFAKNATESYEVKNYIQSFRESQPFDPSDTFKVRRIKAILRKKTPFPFLCSVVVHDTSTGLQQLFTQGTADMLCDVCPDFWDGKGIHPLTPELRKKIHDFYTRASLSAYCTAFAYRPVFSDFSKVLDNFYLELPGGKNAAAEMENVHSTDFVSDAKGLAKAQSGQIFLGMVVMQYKAMPDVLDLIEDFESRCIRFVHFSHENELRSRIFAEKLGLETGWNCHVSLYASSSNGEPHSSEHSSKAASLTTLRSFAQNVIQANEKLKTLQQSQNNIDINSGNNEEVRSRDVATEDFNGSLSTPASPAMAHRVSHSVGPTMERVCSHRSRDAIDGGNLSHHHSQRSLTRSQHFEHGQYPSQQHQAEVNDRKPFLQQHQPHNQHQHPHNVNVTHNHSQFPNAEVHHGMSRNPSFQGTFKEARQYFPEASDSPRIQHSNLNFDQSQRLNSSHYNSSAKARPLSRNSTMANSFQVQCQCCSTQLDVCADNAATVSSTVPFGTSSRQPHRAEFNPSRKSGLFHDVSNVVLCRDPKCANSLKRSDNCDISANNHPTTPGVAGGLADSGTSGICSMASDEGALAVTTSTYGFTSTHLKAPEIQFHQSRPQYLQQPDAFIASRKYVEIGVQTANNDKEDSSSLKNEEAGLDEMFGRLEKLESQKRHSQEEVNMTSGMSYRHPGVVSQNHPMYSVGTDTRDAITEQDEFISLQPMSPGSMSETSSGAISPLPNPRGMHNSHNFQGGHFAANSRTVQLAYNHAKTSSNSPHHHPMMSNNCQANTHQKHPLSRGMATDTPSCDLSGSGNSPIDYCYQCSTLNNSNALMAANHNRVVPGGGIESQCSSIESNCQVISQSNTMSGGVNHLQKVTEQVCTQPCCYNPNNVQHSSHTQGGVNGLCNQCHHNSNAQNTNISHHGSNNTLLSNRAKSPMDAIDQHQLKQSGGIHNTSLRSNPPRKNAPPVPVRRYATLTGGESQFNHDQNDASVALLNPTYNTSQHNHQQFLSNSTNNFSNSNSQSFSKQRGKLSRTGSIVSQATHMQDDAISRTSEQSFGMGSLAGTEGVMFDDLYDLSNRAKLPRGVENIRPHLEHVDNVPLLVPLFTDCTPEATKEMVNIMQENSEIVCVYGSSLNVTNIDIFLQSDVSIGVMPYVPQPCVRQPVCFEPFLPDGRHLSPLGLASALGALPCSLQILRNVSLTNIFHSASRLSDNLKTALLFLLSCHLALIITQVLSAVCFQPPPFSGSLILWLVGFILPLLSTALLANPTCPNSLQWTTARKNYSKILKTDVREFIVVFAMRFLPTCLLLPLMEMLILYTMCLYVTEEDNCLLTHGNTNSTELWNGYRGSYRGALVVAQNLTTWFLVVHLCFISASFVFPKTYVWRRAPFRNLVWTIMCPLIIILQLFYFYSDVQTYKNTPFTIPNTPGQVWIAGVVWCLLALFLSEMVKVYEVRKALKQHRRSKLQFGTKLGMNSPF